MGKFRRSWILGFLVATALGYTSAFAQAPANCRAKDQEADVMISDLHPTQPDVGLGEVLKKVKDLVSVDPTQGSLDGSDPVPVVVGPDGGLYVSDHHHFVLALLMAKNADALVHVKVLENDFCGTCSPSTTQCLQNFWAHMASAHLGYLCSNHDQPISYTQVPQGFGPNASPKPLGNDPYRTLVNVMRKTAPSYDPNGKPCLFRPTDDASAFFWEFRMAEKIRRHIPADKAAEILGPGNAKSAKPSQDIIDAACKAWSEDSSDDSCAARIAADPSLILGSAPVGSARGSNPSKRSPAQGK